MAIYTPRAARRRRLALLVAAGFVVGAVLGVLGGRLTAPTVADQVAAVRVQAREVSAQLRVLSLHSEAGAASLGADGDAGASLALRRADEELTAAFDQAPWVLAAERADLHQRLQELERSAAADAASPSFGVLTDQLAADVDRTFGISG